MRIPEALGRRIARFRRDDDPTSDNELDELDAGLDAGVIDDRQPAPETDLTADPHQGHELSETRPKSGEAAEPVDEDDGSEGDVDQAAAEAPAQEDDPRTQLLLTSEGHPTEPIAAPAQRTRIWRDLMPAGLRGRNRDDRQPAPIATSAEAVRARVFGDTHPGDLLAEEITCWFGDRKVLDRVSLDMRAGQVTALIGPSGCGKSTFLRTLNRMHEMIPSSGFSGRVLLDGQDIYAPDQRLTLARRQIGMVFQQPNVFPADSIYGNVLAGLQLSGIRVSRDERDLLVEDMLRKASLWNEVKDRLDEPAGALSGGQRQRLCIARSLAVSPRVLLMDEPCSALDPTSTRRIEETIEQLKSEVTIVIVTHNMQQARRISDRTAFFLASQDTPGAIVEYGPTEAMFESPQSDDTRRYVAGQFG